MDTDPYLLDLKSCGLENTTPISLSLDDERPARLTNVSRCRTKKANWSLPSNEISLSFFIVSTVPPDERTIRFQQTYFVVARQSSIRA